MIDPTVFIAPQAIVLGDVHLGPDSSVWYNTVIRGDTERIRIGEGTNIQDFTMVHADPGIPCLVGSRVTVGHRAIVHGSTVPVELHFNSRIDRERSRVQLAGPGGSSAGVQVNAMRTGILHQRF